jgi:hypothetical protein
MSTQSPVKETPMPFNTTMIQALLAGTKTQTRRLIKPQPVPVDQLADEDDDDVTVQVFISSNGQLRTPLRYGSRLVECPYGNLGDRIWVQEDFLDGHDYACADEDEARFSYMADCPADQLTTYHWKASALMPRYASRILLEIVSVRVEQLQSITAVDAIAEGISSFTWTEFPSARHRPEGRQLTRYLDYLIPATDLRDIRSARADSHAEYHLDPITSFRTLWDSIYPISASRSNAEKTWDANPWVWVVSFKRIQP